MNDSCLGSHSLKLNCVCSDLSICANTAFVPHAEKCTFTRTFLTADSNMLQKMGNCLKLPVLRVRSSISEKIYIEYRE